MTVRQVITAYYPTAIVAVVIIYATLFPDPAGADELPPIPHLDKLIHAVMFGGLTGALGFDYARSKGIRRPGSRMMAIFATVSLIAGGSIELLQGAMGLGRGADLLDFLADAVGVAVAYFTAPSAISWCLIGRPRKDQ